MSKTTWFVWVGITGIAAACGGSASDLTGAAGAAGVGGVAGTGGGVAGTGGGAGGVPPAWVACADITDCVLLENDCCQLCGPGSVEDAIAVNSAHRDDLERQLCQNHPDPCPLADCMMPDENFLAVCRDNRCQAIDLRLDQMSACTDENECEYRWGSRCCVQCVGDPTRTLVAFSTSSNYMSELCPPEGMGCDACVPQEPPPGTDVICDANHCKVLLGE